MISKVISVFIRKSDVGVFELLGVQLTRESESDKWVKGEVSVCVLGGDYEDSVSKAEAYAKKKRIFLSKSHINYKENKNPIALTVKSDAQKFAKKINYDRNYFELVIRIKNDFKFEIDSNGEYSKKIFGRNLTKDEYNRMLSLAGNNEYIESSFIGNVGDSFSGLIKLNSISKTLKHKKEDVFLNSGYRILKFTTQDGDSLSFTIPDGKSFDLNVGKWYNSSFTVHSHKIFNGSKTSLVKLKRKTFFRESSVIE